MSAPTTCNPCTTTACTTTAVRGGEPSNGDLLRWAAAGSQEAWSELHTRYGRLVVRAARRTGLNERDAADVAQVTWMRLFQHVSAIRDPERLPGWLATTARRESIRISVRAARLPLDDGAHDVEAVGTAVAADAAVLERESVEALERAVENLPDRYRVLLRLLLSDEGLSYAEISRRLRLPVGSIGPMRGRGLELLRRSVGADAA
ncbi:MAG TPA: sigma-70 family RNA polymerase sigma factor [Acidimicrobiales bacterium]|nr:sigma-70 family RNA polymerase sigma factor [Acidimicrobiales bacterium]